MSHRKNALFTLMAVCGVGGTFGIASQNPTSLPNLFPFMNDSGILETRNTSGTALDLTGPFFQSLGTNGRTCETCHRAAQGWGVSANEVKQRFEQTQGLDPIFRTNDGSNCNHDIDTSSVGGRRKAYSLLTDKGLIRVTVDVPVTAEFNVIGVLNPYGCNEPVTLSMYRRPLPTTNLRFLSTLMWDGRESSPQTGTQKITFATNPADLVADLAHQAVDATNGHAQGAVPLTPAQQQAIVDFELSLSTAQAVDFKAGPLDANGATGGPVALSTVTTPAFFVGINDPLGGNPHGTPFTPAIFDLFSAWTATPVAGRGRDDDGENRGPVDDSPAARRASIARGQALFNSKAIQIRGVAGLNDDLNLVTIPGTCGTCHDSPNVGNHSVSAPLNIGVSDASSPLNLKYLPVIRLQNKVTREIKVTSDPGRAMITGLWKDVGRFKGPILRGLASRAPYFHNGSADTLEQVIDFYNARFAMRITPQEKRDLVAFLKAL